MKEYEKYLTEFGSEENPMELSLAQHMTDKPKEKNYQKIAIANSIKLNNALIKAAEAAEMIGIAIEKGAILQNKEELIRNIQRRARWMVQDIEHLK
jgi:hypothetical protein